MKTRKATVKDISQVLELKKELYEQLDSVSIKKQKIIEDPQLQKKTDRLSIQAKALLFTIIGKQMYQKKNEISLRNLKEEYKTYCKWWFIRTGDFKKVVKELEKTNIISVNSDKVKINYTLRETYPIRNNLREILYVKNLKKKWRFERGKIHFIDLVAEENKKILGYLSGYFIKYRVDRTGEILDLIVSKNARGKGVGTELIKEFLNISKKQGINEITLTTPKENKKAIKFYEKLGFKKGNEVLMHWQAYEE